MAPINHPGAWAGPGEWSIIRASPVFGLLNRLYIGRVQSFGSPIELEFDLLISLKRLKTILQYLTIMNEDVLIFAVNVNKSVTLGVVEPFDGSLWHAFPYGLENQNE